MQDGPTSSVARCGGGRPVDHGPGCHGEIREHLSRADKATNRKRKHKQTLPPLMRASSADTSADD